MLRCFPVTLISVKENCNHDKVKEVSNYVIYTVNSRHLETETHLGNYIIVFMCRLLKEERIIYVECHDSWSACFGVTDLQKVKMVIVFSR